MLLFDFKRGCFSESFLNPRFKLENDPMCGVTTGGKEDCFWDCEIGYDSLLTPPECLLKCFSEVK